MIKDSNWMPFIVIKYSGSHDVKVENEAQCITIMDHMIYLVEENETDSNGYSVDGYIGTVGNLAAIFSYSKTKGLFAGVSLEGSVIIERKDANKEFYHQKVSSKDILNGRVTPPAEASELYQALITRCTTSLYPSPTSPMNRQAPPSYSSSMGGAMQNGQPLIPPRQISVEPMAVALYDFKAQRPDDLSFHRGDVIYVTKKTASKDDWWLGRLASSGQHGNFPANVSITIIIMMIYTQIR